MIHTICKELNQRPKDAYKMNYISTLNWLGYFKERDTVIQNQQK